MDKINISLGIFIVLAGGWILSLIIFGLPNHDLYLNIIEEETSGTILVGQGSETFEIYNLEGEYCGLYHIDNPASVLYSPFYEGPTITKLDE